MRPGLRGRDRRTSAASLVCAAFAGALALTPAARAGGYVATAGWGSPGTAYAQLGMPKGIAVDHSDAVYVSDYVNDTVIKYSADGEIMAV